MMRFFVLAFVLIYQCMSQAYAQQFTYGGDNVVIQTHAVTDLYGRKAIDLINARNVIFLRPNPSPPDVREVIPSFLEKKGYNNGIVLGEGINITDELVYTPVLSMFNISEMFNDRPIYVISSKEPVAIMRMARIRQFHEVEEIVVTTEYELRKAISEMKEREEGYLFLNVFHFTDNWGRSLGFKDAEDILISLNHKHLDVGICHDDFKTALAIGPAPDELPDVILNNRETTSVCTSLDRLGRLGSMVAYAQNMGRFYRVVAHSH